MSNSLLTLTAATRPKKVHMAGKMSPTGAVSPRCAKVPRAIDLTRETWTLRKEAVTCKTCLRAIAESE